MKCRFCAVYRSFKLEKTESGKLRVNRYCKFRDMYVDKNDLIYHTEKVDGKKVRRYCDGFQLHPMIYCEQHLWISVHGPTSGCLARQQNEEYPECKKCNLKNMVQELVRINHILQRKRRKPMTKVV